MACRQTGDKPLTEPILNHFADTYMRHSGRWVRVYNDVLMQDCSNSIDNALELLQSCANTLVKESPHLDYFYPVHHLLRFIYTVCQGSMQLSHLGSQALLSLVLITYMKDWKIKPYMCSMYDICGDGLAKGRIVNLRMVSCYTHDYEIVKHMFICDICIWSNLIHKRKKINSLGYKHMLV